MKLEDGGTAVGDVFQYQQDTNSGSWIFTEAIVEVTGAVSSGGLNVGVATNNTTNSSNLLFDIDLSTTGITVGGASVRLDPGDWINATANADPTGLTGNLYLIYVKAGPAA